MSAFHVESSTTARAAAQPIVGQTKSMSKAPHQRALDILVHRCGEWSRVLLSSGRICIIHDVAWGYDVGDEVAHITTNISPPNVEYDVEFFYEVDSFRADEIEKIEDVETGAVFFDSSDV